MNLELKIKARAIASSVKEKDSSDFVLKNASVFESELLREIANQIQFNRILEKKVPDWYQNGQVLPYYGINLEQSSSQATATFKSDYVRGIRGIDLTGGLGVDSFFFSRNFESYIHNEPNSELSSVVSHNFDSLGVKNVHFTQFKAEEFPFGDIAFDWIYLDPSRRDDSNSKLYKIQDCRPNIIEILKSLLKFSENIMVKYSPMLDISLALSQLQNVIEVWVLSEKNEVKELVFNLGRTASGFPLIRCVNLGTTQEEFLFDFETEKNATPDFSLPLKYLYEPNSSLLKAGAFNTVATRYHVQKIAKNSHLYTSEKLAETFPGRKFLIKEVTSFDKKSLNSIVKSGKANITCRNFPLKPEEVRKKLNWKDGGEIYLFLTQDNTGKKLAIVTEKV